MFTMIIILFFIFFNLSNAVLTPLKRNLAYRSPSLTVSGSGLSHDIENIGNQIIRKSILNRRSSSKQNENDTIESALNGNAANEMVLNYDSDKGIDGQDSYQGNISFPFNVASGDPYFNSIILWTHPVPQDNQTQQPICLRYEVSKSLNDFQKKNIVDYGYAWTTIDVDYSFKVEAINLNPLTSYSYRFFACHDHSQISQIGYFKTLPKYDDDQVDKLKIAVFSCSNLPFGYFNAYRVASQMGDLDYAMHVGDYLYESQGDGSTNSYGDGRPLNRVPLPNKEIFTLEDYRTRYKSYRSDKDLQALHQNKAALLVWDDHESLGDNDWVGGSVDSNDTASGTIEGINFTARKKNAIKAYFEWMPIRQVDTTDNLRIWRKFQYGKLADILMLDTRGYDRSKTDMYYNTAEIAAMSNDTNRSLMGGKQERWFYKNLVYSQSRGAIWKIVGQQVVMSHLHELGEDYPYDYDAWDGYKANRRRMFNTIKANKIDNTIFLAGDSHANWVFDAVYEESENDTLAYDPSTGKGALGVEFAGTAVSSPSSYGSDEKTLTFQEYTEKSKELVTINRNLQFAEGATRGFFTVKFTKQKAQADFWGFVNNSLPDAKPELLGCFDVQKGANHVTRPVNFGLKPFSGTIQSQIIDYSKQKWNGTSFA